jgi:hypothetical protein
MNANAVAKNYGSLTPEERFRLILAAAGRGDEAERDRLANAGQRITYTMSDHSPYARAFGELADLVFMELLEDAARYQDALVRGAGGAFDGEEEDCGAAEVEEGGRAEGGPGAKADAEPEDDAGERPAWQRTLDLALAAGFTLKTKADGWMLVCERLSVPPFLLVEGLPGFDRLQRALKLAEHAAFLPEGMVRWLNATRPEGAPEVEGLGLTPEKCAEKLEVIFRDRVEWWGG